jgi:hypothetical protein
MLLSNPPLPQPTSLLSTTLCLPRPTPPALSFNFHNSSPSTKNISLAIRRLRPQLKKVRHGNQREVIRGQAHDQDDESCFTPGCIKVRIEMKGLLVSSAPWISRLRMRPRIFSLGRWECAQVGETVGPGGGESAVRVEDNELVWVGRVEEDCVDGAEG